MFANLVFFTALAALWLAMVNGHLKTFLAAMVVAIVAGQFSPIYQAIFGV